MVGALLAMLGEAVLLFGPVQGPLARRIAWALGFGGQAAMAYAFLR